MVSFHPAARRVGRRARPGPLSVVTALIAGALAFALVSVHDIPSPALRLVGSGTSPLDLHGGAMVEVEVPDAVSAAERAALPAALVERARSMGVDAVAGALDGGRLELTVVGVSVADAAHVTAWVRPRRLALRRVRNGDDHSRALYEQADRGELGAAVSADVDTWSTDHGSVERDYYLIADSAGAIEQALTAAGPGPDGAEILLEAVATGGVAPGRVRTWLVDREVIVGDADVTDATTALDPNTGRAIVLVDFSDDGGRRFGDWTGAHVGDRLAMVVDDRVWSAPVVNGPIRGGRASITMASQDRDQSVAEAESLVASLRARSPLPAGLTARVVRTVAPAHGRLAAARLICAGLAALLALLLAIAATRLGARWPDAAGLPAGRSGAAETVRRIAVTTAVVAGLVALRWLRLPLLDTEAIGALGATVSVAALGGNALFSAAVTIELIAVVIPGWRRRRLGSYADRAPLRIAASALAMALAVAQAYYMAVFLQSSAYGEPVLAAGPRAMLTVGASLVAGVALHALGALWISRHGIGHGMAVLLGMMLVESLVPSADVALGAVLVFAAEAALVAVLTVAATGSRMAVDGDRSVRLPLAGAVPVHLSASLLMMIGPLAVLGVPGLDGAVTAIAGSLGAWMQLGLAAALAALLSWCFARPSAIAALRIPIALSVLYALALVGLDAVVTAALSAGPIGVALPAALLTGLGLDLVGEVRARWRGPLIAADEHHDVHRADAALDAGGGYLRGVHLRALLRFFGPFVPVWRLVPAGTRPAAATADATAADVTTADRGGEAPR